MRAHGQHGGEASSNSDLRRPKVFISYSWTDQDHRELVRSWADRLISDGIDVVIDIYDLKEGYDRFIFMERMVNDETVSHVLVVCDQEYKEKADNRRHGVGTESQIISPEVYEKADQSKFIPLVCEFDDDRNAILPTFFHSRIWIDFSSPMSVNENWEQLIRTLYGKPLYTKPQMGQPPSYITSDVPLPTNSIFAKFNSLRQAILQERMGMVRHNRRDFIDACVDYADQLRVREDPATDAIGEKILADTGKLKLLRDPLVDWAILESESSPRDEYSRTLIEFMEKLRELKSRPAELTRYSETWFEAHSIFVYEVFLYFVAALLKTKSYSLLHDMYSAVYLPPETERHAPNQLDRFDVFQGWSESLGPILSPEGKRLISPTAELIKRHADRRDFPFSEIIQAELLTVLASITMGVHWAPQTLLYAPFHAEFPFFTRTTQHRHFLDLATIIGIDEVDRLRSITKEELDRMSSSSRQLRTRRTNYWTMMNLENMDTLP